MTFNEVGKSSGRDNAEIASANGRVGGVLTSETSRVRVWMLRVEPGQRTGFHCHVLDYFWLALSAGNGRNHFPDGSFVDVEYKVGETVHHTYAKGEFKIHDLENIGKTALQFTTVEFMDSENAPLRI